MKFVAEHWLTVLVAVVSSLSLWLLVQTTSDRRPGIPEFPTTKSVLVSNHLLLGHRVKTIAIGPDPLAEPDPIKPYSRVAN